MRSIDLLRLSKCCRPFSFHFCSISHSQLKVITCSAPIQELLKEKEEVKTENVECSPGLDTCRNNVLHEMMFKNRSNSNCNVIFQPFELTVVSETQQKWAFWCQTVGATWHIKVPRMQFFAMVLQSRCLCIL